MNWDRLKNRMQEEASQKEVKVDIDDIWAAIEPEVDVINQERRKRKFFFFWLVGLGLMLALGSIYFMMDKNAPDSLLVDFEKMEKTTSEHEHELSHAHVHSHSDDEQTDDIKIVTEQNEKAEEEQTISNSQNKIEKHISPKDKTKNYQKNIQSSASTKVQIVEDKLPWKISQSDQKAKPINELVDSDLILSKNKNDITDLNTQLNISIVEKELFEIVNPLATLTLNLRDIENNLVPENNISNYYTALTKEEIEEILSRKKAQYRAPKFTFSLGLMGGIGKAPNNLNTKNDTVSSLLLIRRDTESSLETNQVGLAFSIRHQSGLSLSSGLQQTTMVEKVSFDDTITEVKDIEGVTDIIVNSNGDSTYIMGVIPETTVTVIEKRQYVRYKLLEVPLIMGWQTRDKNNTGWTFGVEAGVVPNISLTTKGIIFDENYGDVNLATDQPSYFKKNIGMSYHLGFSVRRMLFENIELSFKPTVRFFPNDFSAAGNPISQKYNLVSGQVGVNYIFGN